MLTAVVMAGGSARRMGGLPKPFIRVCGRRLIDYALSLARRLSGSILVFGSKAAPIARASGDIEVVDAGGGGYVEDMVTALNTVSRRPVLVLPADICILDEDGLVDRIASGLTLCERVDMVTFTVGGEAFGLTIVCRGPPSNTWVTVPVDGLVIDVDGFNELGVAQIACCTKNTWR